MQLLARPLFIFACNGFTLLLPAAHSYTRTIPTGPTSSATALAHTKLAWKIRDGQHIELFQSVCNSCIDPITTGADKNIPVLP